MFLSIVELLLDHGADIATNVPGPKYGNALKHMCRRHDKDSLAAFTQLFASRALKGDGAGGVLKLNRSGAPQHVWRKLFGFTILVILTVHFHSVLDSENYLSFCNRYFQPLFSLSLLLFPFLFFVPFV